MILDLSDKCNYSGCEETATFSSAEGSFCFRHKTTAHKTTAATYETTRTNVKTALGNVDENELVVLRRCLYIAKQEGCWTFTGEQDFEAAFARLVDRIGIDSTIGASTRG
jgi:hypothetical protein